MNLIGKLVLVAAGLPLHGAPAHGAPLTIGAPRIKVIPVGPQTQGVTRLADGVLQAFYEREAAAFHVLPYLKDPEVESLLREQYGLYAFRAKMEDRALLDRLRGAQGADLVLFVSLEGEFVGEVQESRVGAGSGYFVSWGPSGYQSAYCQDVRYTYYPFAFSKVERSRETSATAWALLIDLRSYRVLYMGRRTASETDSLTVFDPRDDDFVMRSLEAGGAPCWGGPRSVPARSGWPRRVPVDPARYVHWWSAEDVYRLFRSRLERDGEESLEAARADLSGWIATQVLAHGRTRGRMVQELLPKIHRLADCAVEGVRVELFRPWSPGRAAEAPQALLYTFPISFASQLGEPCVEVFEVGGVGVLRARLLLDDERVRRSVLEHAAAMGIVGPLRAVLYKPSELRVSCPLLKELTGRDQVVRGAADNGAGVTAEFYFDRALVPALAAVARRRALTLRVEVVREGYRTVDFDASAVLGHVVREVLDRSLVSPEGVRLLTVDDQLALQVSAATAVDASFVGEEFPVGSPYREAVEEIIAQELSSVLRLEEDRVSLGVYLRALRDKYQLNEDDERLRPDRYYKFFEDVHTESLDELIETWWEASEAGGGGGFRLNLPFLGLGGAGGASRMSEEDRARHIRDFLRSHTTYEEGGRIPVSITVYQVADLEGEWGRTSHRRVRLLRPGVYGFSSLIDMNWDVVRPTPSLRFR